MQFWQASDVHPGCPLGMSLKDSDNDIGPQHEPVSRQMSLCPLELTDKDESLERSKGPLSAARSGQEHIQP